MKFLRRFEEETINFGRAFNIDSIEFVRVDRVSPSLNFHSFVFVDSSFPFLKENLKDGIFLSFGRLLEFLYTSSEYESILKDFI